MGERVRYRNVVFDSARWDGFELREGDILISSPPKCGTTWTQMLCALLIFDGPDFPAPLDVLSPWLDMNTRSRAEVHELLAAQRHRRFIKTHTPLDGLPWDPGVTYLVVGRDPRDVAISFEHHFENMDFDEFFKARDAAVGSDDLAELPMPDPPSEDPAERMRSFVEDDEAFVSLASVLGHLETGWRSRHEPNVALFHFADYSRDLPGELARLARILGIELPAERAAELAREASLPRMRDRAEALAPGTTQNHWKDVRAFFRAGGSGEWRERMAAGDLARYESRVAELAGDPLFADWAHRGRLAAGIELDR